MSGEQTRAGEHCLSFLRRNVAVATSLSWPELATAPARRPD
ncbi:hypothetical protein ACFPRL_36560 [Pseudoclavibacter helvolus]